MSWLLALGALVCVALCATGVILVLPGVRRWRAFQTTPRRSIAEVSAGEVVRVDGIAALLEGISLRAPVSGRVCAGWRVRITWHRRGESAELGGSGVVCDAHEVCDFALQDRSGIAFVRPLQAALLLKYDVHRDSTEREGLSPALRQLLARHGQAERPGDPRDHYRFDEGIIGQGERVAVIGQASYEVVPGWPGAGGSDHPGRAGRALVLRCQADRPLLVTDDFVMVA